MTRETLTMTTVAFMTVVFGIIDYLNDKVHLVTIALALACVLYFVSLYREQGLDMFNIFNWSRKDKYPTWGDIPPPPVSMPGFPEPSVYPEIPKSYTTDSQDGYTVGVDNNNQTILKVTCNYSTTTLTMTETGVRQMIRLLESTLTEGDHSEQ